MYDWQDITRDTSTLQTHAGEPWTSNYQIVHRDIAGLSQQALTFDALTTEHAEGSIGTASDPEVLRCTQWLNEVERLGTRLTAAIKRLEARTEMKNEQCGNILRNMQSMVTRA